MDARDLLDEVAEGRIAWYGKVSVSAPDLATPIRVTIPEFDPFLEWGPCLWQSRDLTSLPAAGDACLVIFDNRRNPWVVAWWPF